MTGKDETQVTAVQEPLRRLLLTFWPDFAWTAAFSGLANLLMLTPTLYMLQVFDRVMVSRNVDTLVALTVFLVLLTATMALAEWVRSRLLVRASARIDARLSSAVFTAGFQAKLQRRAHDPVQALSDMTQLRQFMTGAGVIAVFDAPWAVVYIGVLFLMHPVLGWAGVLFSAVLLFVAWAGSRWTTKEQIRSNELATEASKFLSTRLRHADTMHAMGMFATLRRRWASMHEAYLVRQQGATFRLQRMQIVGKYIQYAQQALILSIGALLVVRGELTIGAVIASNALLSNALRPLNLVVGAWRQFVEARQSFARLEGLLSSGGSASVGDGFKTPATGLTQGATAPLQGLVGLQGVTALAPSGDRRILDNINLELRPGEVVVVTGPSGAGKSTLAQCVLGLWPKMEGTVTVDGVPVQQWSRQELGPRTGYLPQDIQLFDATVAENISRLGPVEPPAVVEAARRAQAHELILGLPKGYDTPVGDSGGQLSGGQRQRIGLARALWGNPRIVVLDEPSSRLDDAGEAALAAAVNVLRDQGATVLLVTHHRNLLGLADRVLNMAQGTIVNEIRQYPKDTATEPA